jgi:hypothetical protein
MTDLDDRLLPKVKALIERLGKKVDFTISTKTGTVATGVVTETTETFQDVKVSPPIAVDIRFVDGVNIKVGDTILFLAAKDLAFVPDVDQKVTIDDVVFTILRNIKHYSGELIAVYELHVRQ